MSNSFKITIPMRHCITCGKELPLTDFYIQSYTGKATNQCRTCINVKRSVSRNRAKHGKFISKEKCRTMEPVINYSLDDWRDAMIHFGGECCYCGVPEGRSKKSKFDREHLIPVSKGGKTVRNNIAPACPTCNRARGNKDLLEWFRDQPFWSLEREVKIKRWMDQDNR